MPYEKDKVLILLLRSVYSTVKRQININKGITQYTTVECNKFFKGKGMKNVENKDEIGQL